MGLDMKYAVNGKCETCYIRDGAPVKLCVQIKGEVIRVESLVEGQCTVCGERVIDMRTEAGKTSPEIKPEVSLGASAEPIPQKGQPAPPPGVVAPPVISSQQVPPPSETTPQTAEQPKKRGFFSFFKKKKEGQPSQAPAEQPPSLPQPGSSPTPESPPAPKPEPPPIPAAPPPAVQTRPESQQPTPTKPEVPAEVHPKPQKEQKKDEEDILPPILPF